MAYVEPTPATFKARYPAFAPVSNTLVQLVLNDAIEQFGECWVERDRAKAQMLLTAHLLASQGEPENSLAGGNGNGGGSAVNGGMKRRKVGDVEVEYFGIAESPSGGVGSNGGYADSFYGTTAYGRQLLLLMRANFPAIAVV